ncbi:MAG TPA: hypothetical protein PK073_03105 [Ignavibacteriaceae bacterium]|jgi:hypothetical protein|nr:MAG: hypothetical protein BWY38_00760 [Ignavibacteria bacterium ADurb.Bin266]OQY75455.1 MAG: hypothetical protein B6D44_01250 [Ignavibacteriales bacterium UTCHB2]HQF41876.1 hypothetical protein [Ignavibacteriaceae bacterium]HQI39663.1 hypothetical protein [Ignavibacteriaceae bacterium]
MLKLKLTKPFSVKSFLLLILFLLFNLSCNTTEPTDDIKPGRRDYTWTVDTLSGLHNPRFRMWGSSPTDIWATTSSNWENSISHYDGTIWISYGVTGLATPKSIYGFSNIEVYVGEAGSGRIWKFDGNNWNQFAQLAKDGHNNIWIENIWGKSPNDFYAFGAYPDSNGLANGSVISRFNSGKWVNINRDELNGVVEHFYSNSLDNKNYLRLTRVGGVEFIDSTIIYEFINDGFNKIYSSLESKGTQADIALINNEVIFVLGNQIARRTNNQFQTILNVTNPNFYQRIWGRNTKDIFLLMTDGLVHYNGTDMEYLFYFNRTPSTQIYGSALFEKDVFFLVDEAPSGLSLVYHGKLD